MKRLYNYYFPTPSYIMMNSYAIDISDQSIKYGELIATSSGLKLSKYGKKQIPDGVMVSGKIEKEDEMVRLLKEIKEEQNLHFVRVSLPEEQMYLFTLSLPKTAFNNIRETILLQIEEYIPLKAVDVVFDYDVIREDDKGIFAEVVAVSNATMESYLSIFDKAGLVPVSFEIEAQALARAVIKSDDFNPVMIVDFGSVTTGVTISKDGHVYLTTTLLIGGRDLTNMVAKNFSLSFEEAEKMKRQYNLNKGLDAQDIFPAILNGVSVLRDEISKQNLYWDTHHGNNDKYGKINRIILCGGDANLAGLSEYLELSMKMKVENANIWINISKPEDSLPEICFEESLSYATVVGLSLGNYLYKSQPGINVLPTEKKKILRKEYWMRFFTMMLNLIALVSVLASFLLFPSYFLSKSREDIIESKLETFNSENPNLVDNNIDKITNDINSKLIMLSNAEAPYQINDKVFNSILSSRTDGITFSQILLNTKVSEGQKISYVKIYGKAINRDSLRNFKNTIDKNPNFSDIDLPISDFLEKSNLNFTISITIK